MPKIVTAHTGIPHITADDIGALHQKIFGCNDYLLSDNSEEFKAVMLNSDTLQMPKAEIVVQGTHIRISNTDKVKIEAGQSGQKRIDFVVCRYTKNDDGVENAEIDVVKGVTSLTPELPVVAQGDIRNGATVHEMPLFKVEISGVSIEAVTSVCETVKSLSNAFMMISGQSESINDLSDKVMKLDEKSKSTDNNTESIQKINTNKLLWSGASYMNETQTITLSDSVSEQTNGIILVFSTYSGGLSQDYDFHSFVIPKWVINKHSGQGHKFEMMGGLASAFSVKYLYISDKKITGHKNNTQSGNGIIPYSNSAFVLRYVIGF